jgi:hypothetical protein
MDIIIGSGEIGRSLYNVLQFYYDIELQDVHDYGKKVSIMHICFPYSDKFCSEVERYQKIHCPDHTIIHSTVPAGTNAKLNSISSPVIGIHPHLELSLKTFIKYLGGENASEVADYFRRAGFRIYIFEKSYTPELMKIMDTTHYGMEIEYVKEVKRMCKKFNVPFEAWTLWVNNYNQGYKELGYPEYVKPNMVPIMKVIAGHCVLPNCDLLENDFTKFLKKRNE